MRTYRIYSLSNVQAYHTAVFTIVILYIAFPVPIGLKTGSLYFLTTFFEEGGENAFTPPSPYFYCQSLFHHLSPTYQATSLFL